MIVKKFNPLFDILPQPQKALWSELKDVPDTFILYGGTAIALQLGHRESIDFDFFSHHSFDPDDLFASLPFLNNAKIVQRDKNTLSVKVDRAGEVYLSFFGLPDISSIEPPLKTQDNIIQVASLLDLAGMKACVVQKRAEWKDYADLAALIDAGVTLPMALTAGQIIYKNRFNPEITLKALSYFDDVDGVTEPVKRFLQEAVKSTDVRHLPPIHEIRASLERLRS